MKVFVYIDEAGRVHAYDLANSNRSTLWMEIFGSNGSACFRTWRVYKNLPDYTLAEFESLVETDYLAVVTSYVQSRKSLSLCQIVEVE